MEILPAWRWGRCGSPRLHGFPNGRKRCSQSRIITIQTRPHRTINSGPQLGSKSTRFPSSQLRHALHERVVSLVVLENHWQYATHVFLAIHRLPNPALSHSIFCSLNSCSPLPAPVPAAPSETWPLLCARALACAYAERLLAAKPLQSPA